MEKGIIKDTPKGIIHRPINSMKNKNNYRLMKSKHRVQKHGEVFTPYWVVDKMMAIPGIKEKAEDIFATFLEPSAGEGAFLLAVENKKLQSVTEKYGKDLWNDYALWALTSIYAIEYLEDNLAIARQSMLDLFSDYYRTVHEVSLSKRTNIYKSAQTIIRANVVQGDTLTHKTLHGDEIVFSQWKQLSETPNMVKRELFTYSSLSSSEKETNKQLSLFDISDNNKQEIIAFQRYSIVNIKQVWKEEKESV